MSAAAVQSTANPAPSCASDGRIEIDDGVAFDPFEELQEVAELEQVRQQAMRRGLARKSDWM